MSSQPLLPGQRQIRHLRGIHARNLHLDTLSDTFFKVFIKTPDVLKSQFRSNLLFHKCNQNQQQATEMIQNIRFDNFGNQLTADEFDFVKKNALEKFCIYSSEIMDSTVNPSWNFEELEFVKEHSTKSIHRNQLLSLKNHIQWSTLKEKYIPENETLNHCKEFSIQLFTISTTTHLSSEEKFIMSLQVDLEQLIYIGKIESTNITSPINYNPLLSLKYEALPLNCILFEFVDGIFVTEDTLKLIDMDAALKDRVSDRFERLQFSESPPVFIDRKDVEAGIMKLVGLRFSIQELEEKISEARGAIEDQIKKKEKFSLLQERIVLLKDSIKKKSLAIERKQKLIEEEKKNLEIQQQNIQENRSSLEQSQKQLEQMQENLFEEQSSILPQEKEQLALLQLKISKRRKNLLRQLQLIFPIQYSEKYSTYTINGLPIYRGDQLGMEEDQFSALGYIAECLRIISKLFQIPLKYQVYPYLSRSFVREEVVDTTSQGQQRVLLPLFLTKASEKPKYQRAVFLLNVNIFYLMRMQGLKLPKLANKFDIVNNMRLLCESLLGQDVQ